MTFEIVSSPSDAQRFTSLEVFATVSLDGAALGRVMMRHAMDDPHYTPESVKFLSLEEEENPSNNRIEHRWNVWWEPPALWREELIWPNGANTVIVIRPDASLVYLSFERTLYTTERPDVNDREERSPFRLQVSTLDERLSEFPLIYPGFPASDWQVASVAPEVYLGRAAHRVRATRRSDYVRPEYGRESGYWSGINEYECIVDDALQIVSSITAFDEGVPVGTIAADYLGVDTAIPRDTFNFAPPKGTRFAHFAKND